MQMDDDIRCDECGALTHVAVPPPAGLPLAEGSCVCLKPFPLRRFNERSGKDPDRFGHVASSLTGKHLSYKTLRSAKNVVPFHRPRFDHSSCER